jgi:hypothetical protein
MIEENLKSLNLRYRRSKSIESASFASKLAILELCGWIEVSLDECIDRASNRVLQKQESRKFIAEKVKKNSGFDYDSHFRTMIVNLIGIWGFEKIVQNVETTIVVNFMNELNTLKIKRNSLAHTYTRAITEHYDAPSITLERFVHIRAGFEAFERALQNYCR